MQIAKIFISADKNMLAKASKIKQRRKNMYCKKCGAQIPDGNNFCQNCGTPTAAVNESVSEQTATQQPFPAEQKALKNQIEAKLYTPENKEKINNILEKIKIFFKVRFVKFLKNYKNFKNLPKQSKIKHIMFPIIIVLVIAICSSFGVGSAKGLNENESNAIAACSMLPSDLKYAASVGAVSQVYFGSLANYYEIKSVEKEKANDDIYKITLNIEYKKYGYEAYSNSDTQSGTLIFSYNKSSGIATLSGGSAKSDFEFIASQYAMN